MTEQTSVGSAQRTVNTGDLGSIEEGGKKKMCRALTEWIEEEKGILIVQVVEALMKNQGIELLEACRILNVSQKEYKRAKDLLGKIN